MQYLTIGVVFFQLLLVLVQSAAYGWLGVPGLVIGYTLVMIFSALMLTWLSPLMIIQMTVQTLYFLSVLGVKIF